MTKAQYDLLTSQIAPQKVGSRTNSAAMLAWFLEDVWRLDDADAEAAICDGNGDKGIDGLVVDDDLLEITVLQGKYRETPKNTQGDSDLKALVGAAAYFKSPATVDQLVASKPNADLLRLIRRSEIRERLERGAYAVRLVFVTNALPDAAAVSYMKAAAAAGTPIDLWDRARLAEIAARTRRPDLRSETVTLTAEAPVTKVVLTDRESIAIALVSARQLTQLPGIDDLSLFARNVRLSAGKTRINRELARTVRDQEEHPLFAAYHNGLTLLTHGLEVSRRRLTLNGIGVVNGCQSLLALHDSSNSLTDSLIVLVKVVEVPDDSDVADKITFRSNNQNAVNLRDQRSTEPVMRDLQGEVRAKFPGEFDFLIRVGDKPEAPAVLDNTTAAQLITATYLREPYAAVRKVRLFDEEFRRIFSRAIDADKLYFLYTLDAVVREHRSELGDELKASFASIRFTLAYLVHEVLKLSPQGAGLSASPGALLPSKVGQVRTKLAEIVVDVISEVNFHVTEELAEDPTYDPKVAFKSRSGVAQLEKEVLKSARRQAKKSKGYLFSVT